MYIFVRQYNDNQISLLKQQVKKCPIINITSVDIKNYEQCVNNYIKNNVNMKNISLSYDKEQYNHYKKKYIKQDNTPNKYIWETNIC